MTNQLGLVVSSENTIFRKHNSDNSSHSDLSYSDESYSDDELSFDSIESVSHRGRIERMNINFKASILELNEVKSPKYSVYSDGMSLLN